MASSLNTNFGGLPIEEVVPDSAMVKGVSRSSLLTGRRRVRFQPQTGVTASPNGIIQFVLADSTSLLDLNSVVLSCTVTTTGTGDVALDDGPAWMRRVQVSLNGQMIDDTDNAHRNANANVYASADRAWYNGAGSFAGYWAANPSLVSGAAYPSVQYAVGDVSGSLVAASVRNKAGMQVGYPLGLVSSMFQTKQYLPLSQCGELVVQIVCAANGEAIFQRPGATDGAYSLSDIFLEADLIQPHYLYQELLNKVSQQEGESGLVIPINTTIVSQGQALTGSNQPASIVVSRASNNLRKVIVTQTPTGFLSSANFPAVSCFGHHGFSGIQFRCGSLYFPSQEANSDARAFWLTQTAFGEPINDRNGTIDYNLFIKTTGPLGQNYEGITQKQYWGDSCVLAYSFDNFKGATPLDADGISVIGQAGSQLVVLLRNNVNAGFTAGVTPTVSLIATRYIVCRGGALRIEGV